MCSSVAKIVFGLSVFLLSVVPLCAQTATPTPLPGTGDGAAATFYGNTNFTGTVFPTYLETIGDYFASCSPDPSISPASFSGKFTAQLEPVYSETYTFSAVVQGGVSVIVNGTPLISQWTNSASTSTYTGTIALTALQRVPLEVDYFKTTTPGQIELFWNSPSQPQQLIPMDRLYSGLTFSPTPPPQNLEASYAPGLTVDGSVTAGAWSLGTWTPLHGAWGENLGINGEFQVKWDSNYLYLGCRIHNPTPHDSFTGVSEDYDDESIEFFLDMTNQRAASIGTGDFQYLLQWSTNAISETNNNTAGVLGQTSDTSYGYSAVLAIPWTTLGVPPSSAAVYGMDVGANLCPQPGCPLSRLRWNGSILDAEDTRPYGDLTLQPPPPSLGPAQTPYFYPEPAYGNYVNLAYDMREPGTMKLRVWNAAGNLVATLNDRKGAGNQVSYLPISGFAAGHYFYNITLSYDSGDVDDFKTQVLPIQK